MVVANMMSFDEVRAYLSTRARNPDGTNRNQHGVGALSLDEVRQRVMSSETQVQTLLRGMTLKREREMAGELRGLQIKQQNARAKRSQQETEIRALIADLEQKKEDELRRRLDKERIEQAVKQAKESDMKRTEEEKRKELERLAKERTMLAQKERELQNDIDKLHGHLVEREKEARAKQKIAQDILNQGKLHPRKHAQERLIQLACERGQRAAQLELEKSQLEQQRQELNTKIASIQASGTEPHLVYLRRYCPF
jgi:DNA repair exonuclease SbcCD ATPase subunit